jgi:two-component system LytT family response regulator
VGTHYVKTEHERIRTVIVDDERLARDAIRMRLQDEPDVEVVGEAATGREAVTLIAEALPDVAFLDVQMPGMDGFEVLDCVAPPGSRLLCLSPPTIDMR